MSRYRSLSLLVSGLILGLTLGLAAPAAGASRTWLGPVMGYDEYPIPRAILVTHPGSPRNVWVTNYGVLRSTQRGATWRQVGESLTDARGSVDVRGLTADLSAPGALWAATPDAVFHTSNGGSQWQSISDASFPTALAGETPLGLAAPQKATSALSAWTPHRLLQSLDGGRSWRLVLALGEETTILGATPATQSVLYLAVSGPGGTELRKTRDGGATWTSLRCPGADSGIGGVVLTQNALLVATGEGLWRSTNGGSSWRESLSGSGFSVVTNPLTPGTVWALGGSPSALWLSLDGGETWAPRNSAPDPAWLAAAGPEPGSLYGVKRDKDGHDVAIVRSVDGGRTWNGVVPLWQDWEAPPSRISFQPGHPSRVAFVIGYKLFRSNDGGTTWWWLPAAPASINDAALDPSDPNRIEVAGYWDDAITTDGGRTWTDSGGGLYTELLVRATPTTLYSGGYGMSRSRDDGRSWEGVFFYDNEFVQKLVVDPAHPERIFALAVFDSEHFPPDGPMWGWGSLWRSTNGGATWSLLPHGLNAFDYDARSSLLWGTLDTDLLVSRDLGATWQTAAQLPFSAIDLMAPPDLPGTLYASSDPGLLRSRDNGRTWEILDHDGYGLLALTPGDPRPLFGMDSGRLVRLQVPE